MSDVIFVALALLYILVERQVAYWTVMSAVGSKLLLTPPIWFNYEILWILLSWILFAATIVMAFMQTLLPVWAQILVILAINRLLKWSAQSRACSSYRKGLHRSIAFRKERGEEVGTLEEEVLLTDEQLLRRSRERVRMGIVN